MKFCGLELPVNDLPELDPGFVPLEAFFAAHQKLAEKPLCIAVERSRGQIGVWETRIIARPDYAEADAYYVDRLVKFLLWSWGGFRVYVCGDEDMADVIVKAYSTDGSRAFDKDFMERVYERPFEVVGLPYDKKPAAYQVSEALGRHVNGCRIGFDAGGSDRKVSAVIDGETVYSEEVVWFPKTNADPDYHFNGIVEAFKTAASKMPRVDGIGVSSAGVYIDNKPMVASLFLKVSPEDYEKKVKNIYMRAAAEIGDVPLVVANDGDVTALAGAMGLGDNAVLGVAMGTSEAVGYVDPDGNITGWLNELAFAPVDGAADAMADEWSGDIGCGVKYFSQDAVIKLAPRAGIELTGASPAEKLKEVQALMAADDVRAAAVYRSIGVYLAHTLALYARFYDVRHVLMLGRVMSGKGGDIILEVADEVMSREYPDLRFRPEAPDEKTRRVGQSVAAASLPEITVEG